MPIKSNKKRVKLNTSLNVFKTANNSEIDEKLHSPIKINDIS